MPPAPSPPTISIIAPVYNEEQALPVLYDRISATLDAIGEPWELVLVNDGSWDRSLEIMRELHEKDERVRIVNFSRNFGHQIAITAGTDYAQGQAVIIIDADLQDPPSLFAEMIGKWREGYEVVYAVRAEREGETWFKKTSAALFYRIIYRITEGNKERIQAFQGVVISKRKGGANATFTVRKVSYGIGVERVFPMHSPSIDRVEVVTRGRVRRSKIYYLRKLRGKAARIRERRFT